VAENSVKYLPPDGFFGIQILQNPASNALPDPIVSSGRGYWSRGEVHAICNYLDGNCTKYRYIHEYFVASFPYI